MTDLLRNLIDAAEADLGDDSSPATTARLRDAVTDILGDRGQYRPSYNGWKNRETWNTALWITNDEGSYERAREIVAEAVAGSDYDTRGVYTADEQRRYARRVAGEALKEWWDEANAPGDEPTHAFGSAGPLADAWTYALAWVEWDDVADAVKDESQDWLDLIPGRTANSVSRR